MQTERVADLSVACSTTVRYLYAAVSANNLQATLTSLEDIARRSVAMHRYVLRWAFCTLAGLLRTPLVTGVTTSGPHTSKVSLLTQLNTTNNNTHTGPQRYETVLNLTKTLLQRTLDRPNALTLAAAALDFLPSTALHSPAHSSPAQQSTQSFGSPVASNIGAGIVHIEGVKNLLNHVLELPPLQLFTLLAGLFMGSAVAEVREIASTLLAEFNLLPLAPLEEKEESILRSISLVLRPTPSTTLMPRLVEQLKTLLHSSSSKPKGVQQLPPLKRRLLPGDTISAPSTSSFPPTKVSVAQILREVGTGCVTTTADSKDLIGLLGREFTEVDVAEVLGFFASPSTTVNDSSAYRVLTTIFSSHGGGASSRSMSGSSTVVNGRPLLDAMHPSGKKYRWDEIIRLLDVPSEDGFEGKTITVIFDAYHSFNGDEYPPLSLFLGRWKNTKRQRSALTYLLQNPDKCNAKDLQRDVPEKILQAVRDDAAEQKLQAASLPVVGSPLNSSTSGVVGSPAPSATTIPPANRSGVAMAAPLNPLAALDIWSSSLFVDAVIHVASRESRFEEEVLQPAMMTLPLLFLYLLLGNPQLKNSLKSFVVLKRILAHHRPPLERLSTFVLPHAEKHQNLDALINLFSELTMAQPSSTIEVLDILLKVQPVKRVLQTSSSPRLVVALAMCMGEAAPARENGENWLQQALDGKLHFCTSSTENRFAVAMYIVEIAEMLLAKNRFKDSATSALNAFLGTPLKDMLPNVAECARALLASNDSLFSADVEEEALAVFKEMYRVGHTNEALQTIQELRASTSPRSKDVYTCFLHILFEESSALSCYPPKELSLFGTLFGRLLAADLLLSSHQQRAWSLLLPAIMKPMNNATGEFGVLALKQLKPRLAEWPQHCRALRHVKDLDFKVPGVMAAIYRGIREDSGNTNNEAAKHNTHSTPSNSTTNTTVKKPTFVDPAIVSLATSTSANNQHRSETSEMAQLHTLNIKSLLADGNITSPPPVIQDQINFLLGNTDVKNLGRNAEDLASQLRPEYYEYFAHYLVVKRAALEPNNHGLYIELVTKLGAKDLDRAIRTATVSAVKRLLKSNKIKTSTSDEWTLLGNLGLWLGSITLRKNIPLLHNDLSFEDLLAEGIREQCLAAVTTFMSKVLESCARSSFFAPPNPWTMYQVCLFYQVAKFPHIKQRMRLEFEIFLTKLELNLNDIKNFAEEFHMNRSSMRCPPPLLEAYQNTDRTQHMDFNAEEESGSASPRPSSLSPELGGQRAGGSTLQPDAEPFQPRDYGGRGPSMGGSPSAGPMGAALSPTPQDGHRHERPPIELTQSRIQVPKELEDMGKDLQRKVYDILKQMLNDCNEQLGTVAKRAARCTLQLIIKEWNQLRCPPMNEMPLSASFFMARSLASNDCYISVKKQLGDFIRFKVLQNIFRFRGLPVDGVEGGPNPSAAALDEQVANEKLRIQRLAEPFFRDCENLCLRVLEYDAGKRAVAMLHQLIETELPSFAMRSQSSALTQALPIVSQSFRDFIYCFPAANAFMQTLRTIEDAVNRPIAPPTLAEAGAAAPAATLEGPIAVKSEAELDAIFASEKRQLEEMITPESAVYIVGPMLQRLFFATRVEEERRKERLKAAEAAMPPVAVAPAAGALVAPTAALAVPPAPTGPVPIAAAVGGVAGAVAQQQQAAAAAAAAAAILADSPEMEARRAKLWRLYLDILAVCLQQNESAVRDEASSVFLQQDGRYAHHSLVVELLRLKLFHFHLVDSDLEILSTKRNMRSAVSEFISKAIMTDRVLTRSHLRRTLQAMQIAAREVAALSPSPPAAAASGAVGGQMILPLANKPLSQAVQKEIKRLIIPIEIAVKSEERYLAIAQEFDEWIVAKANSKLHPRSTSSGGNSSQWYHVFVQNLQHKGYLECDCLIEFLNCLICLCVEDHATRLLELERQSNTPPAKPDPWCPPLPRSPYDASVFNKCDYFVDLFQVLLRCVFIRSEESVEQRADVTLLRRALEVFTHVLPKHHYAASHFDDWSAPVHRSPPPADTGYIPMFYQQPYVRIFSNMLLSIQSYKSDPILTMTFLSALRYLTPSVVPGFAFGWLELVSHRLLLARTLKEFDAPVWDSYAILLVEALRFINEVFNTKRSAALIPTGLVFFKAFVKLIVVLHHDFPQFLVAKNYLLYSVTPAEYLQLLNLYNVRWLPLPAPSAEPPAAAEKDDKTNSSKATTSSARVPPPIPVLPIVKVGQELESSSFGFGGCPQLLEALTKALVAKDSSAMTPALMQQVVDRIASSTTMRLLHPLVLHVYFTVHGISCPLVFQRHHYAGTVASLFPSSPSGPHGSSNSNNMTGTASESSHKAESSSVEEGVRAELKALSAAMPPAMPAEALRGSPAMVFFRYVCDRLEFRHRYFFLHACAHHLRVSGSSECVFFHEVLRHLFTTPPTVAAAVALISKSESGTATPSREKTASSSTNSGANSPRGGESSTATAPHRSGNPLAVTAAAAVRQQTAVQEQIVRVVLERCLTYRPRPFSLTHMLETLIQHPEFKEEEFSKGFQLILPRLPQQKA